MPGIQQTTPIPSNAKCIACGYSLYQLETDRCPECGRGFDRRDPLSMGIHSQKQSSFFKRLQLPHSRFTLALPWTLTGMIFIAPLIPYTFGYLIGVVGLTWIVMFDRTPHELEHLRKCRIGLTQIAAWSLKRPGQFARHVHSENALAVGIIPSGFSSGHQSPWATGIVFILEDDPGYKYDNAGRWHLRGQWYGEYRF